MRGSADLLKSEVTYPWDAGLGFGIGLLHWALDREPQLLDAAIEASPQLISVSFGETWKWAERVHGSGIVTAAQIACVESARAAHDAGIEVLVARAPKEEVTGIPPSGRCHSSRVSSMRSNCLFWPPCNFDSPGVRCGLGGRRLGRLDGDGVRCLPRVPSFRCSTFGPHYGKGDWHCCDKDVRHRPRLPMAHQVHRTSTPQ